jgi:hypothetical protein
MRSILGLLALAICSACNAPLQRGAFVNKPEFSPPKFRPDRLEEAAMPYHPGQDDISSVSNVKQRHEADLMAIEGVEGLGIGQDAIGDVAIVVYVRDEGVAKRIPRTLDGLNVQVQVTGPIDALKL